LGQIDCITLMLTSVADQRGFDARGAIELARERGHEDMAQFLRGRLPS